MTRSELKEKGLIQGEENAEYEGSDWRSGQDLALRAWPELSDPTTPVPTRTPVPKVRRGALAGEQGDPSRRYHDDPLVGKTLGGKHHVLKLLGRGAMGRVFLVEDIELKREVAVKVVSVTRVSDQIFIRRFRREARALAAIGHPNVVQVLEIGETDDGEPYFVMEHLKGHELAEELVRTGHLGLPRAIDITGQILFALEATHNAGIVHRDLKPENIFLTRRSATQWFDREGVMTGDDQDFVKILDFGLSRFSAGQQVSGEITVRNSILGSPPYMAPEQILDAGTADVRADLYSVGAILFECLTGQTPHIAEDNVALLTKVLYSNPSCLRSLRPEVPKELASVLERALAKRPDRRFQTAGEFIGALRPFYQCSLPFSASLATNLSFPTATRELCPTVPQPVFQNIPLEPEPDTVRSDEPPSPFDDFFQLGQSQEPPPETPPQEYVHEDLPPTKVTRQSPYNETLAALVPPPKSPLGSWSPLGIGTLGANRGSIAMPDVTRDYEEVVVPTGMSHSDSTIPMEPEPREAMDVGVFRPTPQTNRHVWAIVAACVVTVIVATILIVTLTCHYAFAEQPPQKVVNIPTQSDSDQGEPESGIDERTALTEDRKRLPG